MNELTHNAVIRDCILGNRLVEAPRHIRKVIDSREFQRLRHIRQTGLTSYVFPTAEHSRFAHSIGVFATANQFFDQLQQCALGFDIKIPPFKFDADNQKDFCIAALVHDVGHTAFSHVLETNLLPDGFLSHEACSRALVVGEIEKTELSAAIEDVADRDAVLQMLDKRHPNKALNDLISSTFDVDRCDYVLRDSMMTGVEYGKYDLAWLVHSLSVSLNINKQPVLALDGPRGLDALRQFLSGRRYLYRQVYYHAAVRAAQLVLKGIFERIQDTAGSEHHAELAPVCLAGIVSGRRPTLGEFIRTTDVEILYMIREFAERHEDPVLKYLCQTFVSRSFPKAVLDSARVSVDLEKTYRISLKPEEPPPPPDPSNPLLPLELPEPLRTSPQSIEISEFLEDIVARVRTELVARGAPPDAARYLVSFDRLTFVSAPPTDLLLKYNGVDVSLDDVKESAVRADLDRLLESFAITRCYVPRVAAEGIKEHNHQRYSWTLEE